MVDVVDHAWCVLNHQVNEDTSIITIVACFYTALGPSDYENVDEKGIINHNEMWAHN